jgi:hypothetical protein
VKHGNRLPSGRGVKKYRLEVFNDWGERLFLSLNSEDGWDGHFKGEEKKLGGNVLLSK